MPPDEVTASPQDTVDLTAFREAFRSFFAEWNRAGEEGATIEDLILALEEEGVTLPPFVRQLL